MPVPFKVRVEVDVLDDFARSLFEGSAAGRAVARVDMDKMVEELFSKSPLCDNP
jgi:hypothetical protein